MSCHVMQVISAALDKPRIVKFKGALDLVTETDEASERAVLQVSDRQGAVLLHTGGYLIIGLISICMAGVDLALISD